MLPSAMVAVAEGVAAAIARRAADPAVVAGAAIHAVRGPLRAERCPPNVPFSWPGALLAVDPA